MICVIEHIHKDAKDHSDSDNRKQVNNDIKILFSGASEEEMAVTQDIFWTEYIDFDNNIDSFYADEFICKSKDSKYGNSHFWNQNIYLLAPGFLVLFHVDSHQRFLELMQQSVIEVT